VSVLDNKVALVTGATRGIGNAIAVRLARDGFKIVATGTSLIDDVKENIDEIRNAGTECIYVRSNLGEEEGRKSAVEAALNNFGRIDVLVNNAGVAPKTRSDILFTTEENFDYVVGINLKGTFFMTQLVANEMIKLVERDREARPVIVNMSSVSAYASSTQRGEYCMSKAGISMITTLFADRLAEYDINVFEIRPGIIATDMTAKVQGKYDKMILEEGITPIRRWGQPSDIANAVSILCSNQLSYCTGQVLNIDGGFHIRRL
jgi:NAD(P)-dependent dehydrogenase (short-subunit alcohol dehydrogenase family)